MATLMRATGNGWRRRCDAKCHEAEGRECHCICGGRFHGADTGGYDVREEFQEASIEALEEGVPLGGLVVRELRGEGTIEVKLASVQLRLLEAKG